MAQSRRNLEAPPSQITTSPWNQQEAAGIPWEALWCFSLYQVTTSKDHWRPAEYCNLNQGKSILPCLLGYTFTLSKHHTFSQVCASVKHPFSCLNQKNIISRDLNFSAVAIHWYCKLEQCSHAWMLPFVSHLAVLMLLCTSPSMLWDALLSVELGQLKMSYLSSSHSCVLPTSTKLLLILQEHHASHYYHQAFTQVFFHLIYGHSSLDCLNLTLWFCSLLVLNIYIHMLIAQYRLRFFEISLIRVPKCFNLPSSPPTRGREK